MSWLRRMFRRSRGNPPTAATPSLGFDAAISQCETRYDQLREGLLALLFLRTKLAAETGHAAPRLSTLDRRLRDLTEEMTRCRGELEELRLSRLDAAAELAYVRAL